MRPRRSFRVVLDTECRDGTVLEAFDSVVVEVDVSHANVIEIEAVRIHSETMILSRYLDLIAVNVENRMVSPVMAEFELERTAAQGEAENLMTEADSEDGLLT